GYSANNTSMTPYIPAQTLIEHWDGTQWSIVLSPNWSGPDHLYGITAIAANNIWAVGDYDNGGATQALTEHWDGIQWRTWGTPSPDSSTSNALYGITALSANNMWAVGYSTSCYASCCCDAMIV